MGHDEILIARQEADNNLWSFQPKDPPDPRHRFGPSCALIAHVRIKVREDNRLPILRGRLHRGRFQLGLLLPRLHPRKGNAR